MNRKENMNEFQEKCWRDFREFAEASCKEIALMCRAAQVTLEGMVDVKTVYAETAQKWFQAVDDLSEAEFDFLMKREFIRGLMEKEEEEVS